MKQNKKQYCSLIMILFVFVATLTGCGQTKVIDRNNTEIKIPAQVETIVSLSPAVTETLLHLDLRSKLVGVDKYSNELERIGGALPAFDLMTPDLESVIQLNPDVVFVSPISSPATSDPFQKVVDAGIAVIPIATATSIEQIQEDVVFIGKVVGREEIAKQIITTMQEEMSGIVEKIKNSNQPAKKVYYENATPPQIYTTGSDTFVNEMITTLGGINIFADQIGWISVSAEQIINQNPDIIFTSVNYVENPVQDMLTRTGWSNITAIKQKQVYQVDANSAARPNENIVLAFHQMASAMYPELFKNEASGK